MDIDLFRSVVTLVLLVLFVALWLFAWSPRRKADFDAAAQLPLADDSRPRSGNENEGTSR